MIEFEKDKEQGKYTVEQLLEVMKILRAPDGCPWDKVQTHKSIRNNFLEETYEAVDAIDTNDKAALREELGDVLMQVVFHSTIAEEDGEFTFSDVVDELVTKLVYRHPHIFSDTVAETSEKVLENWEKLKQTEKHQKTYSDTLKSVPKAFPSLMKCAKVQKRAAKAGAIISREYAINQIESSIKSEKTDVGRMLFYAVALARSNDTDCEEALSKETEDYVKRFCLAEEKSEDLKNII